MTHAAALSCSGLTRRASLIGAAACLIPVAARAAPAIPSGGALAFRMMRHGSDIGRHDVAFDQDGGTLIARVTVEARVSFAGIPIVRYSHRATETWQGGTLVALSAHTDRNGTVQWADARRDATGALRVTGSQTKPYAAPADAVPTTYWNQAMLDGPMISAEDGVLLRPVVVDRGLERIRDANGTLAADHYALTGPFAVDVWYDTARQWAALAFTVVDGSEVRYQRL
jgi:hypothetical protein